MRLKIKQEGHWISANRVLQADFLIFLSVFRCNYLDLSFVQDKSSTENSISDNTSRELVPYL